MLRRWIKNLRWLFNSPCTTITDAKSWERLDCKYCGALADWNYPKFSICYDCMEKAFDKALGKKEDE